MQVEVNRKFFMEKMVLAVDPSGFQYLKMGRGWGRAKVGK